MAHVAFKVDMRFAWRNNPPRSQHEPSVISLVDERVDGCKQNIMISDTPFSLTPDQRERLLMCRAAWEEGDDEERFERLRQREEDSETLRAFARLLQESHLSRPDGALPYARLRQLLTLVRALAPNPNLDARLLRKPDEPEAFSRDLHDLLFAPTSLPNRLRGFLARRHMGGQTAMQLLCAAFPEEYPLVTQTGLNVLELSREQKTEALAVARQQYQLPTADMVTPGSLALPDTDPVLRLLGDVVVYQAVRATLEADDYIQVYRLLTQGMAARPRRAARLRRQDLYASAVDASLEPAQVREEKRDGYPAILASIPEPPGIANFTSADAMNQLEQYVAARGFTYPPLTLRNYYLCLQSKPFVLLGGGSGTGKTRLTSLFAEAITDRSDTQYRLIPVRPDWSHSGALLMGSGANRTPSTPFLEFLRRAERPENAYRAFFLCLDEMNLAQVDHYFAEILSAMETPTRELLLQDGQQVRLPANLFITGTLNADSSAGALPRKVLDRANLLTFHEVSLRETERSEKALTGEEKRLSAEQIQRIFLFRRIQTATAAREKLQQCSASGSDFAGRVIDTLVAANELLQPHGLSFAYRVRDEVLRYCANSFDVDGRGLLTPESPDDLDGNLHTALDFQFMQRVLPRFSGSQDALETPLRELMRWAEKAGYLRTGRRLAQMLVRLQRDGSLRFEDV